MESSRRRDAGRLLLAGYTLLLAAWLFSNPPFAAPDEQSHYVRALALSEGQLLGEPSRLPVPGLSAEAQRWADETTRAVEIPRGSLPRGFDCMTYRPQRSARCLEDAGRRPRPDSTITAVGTYPPTPYLLPAVTVGLADSASGSLRAGRLAIAALWLLLCLIALRSAAGARDDPGLLAATTLTLTPQVVFLGATMNGSALELIASIAFVLALLRAGLAREPAAGDWAAVAIAGVLLATARASGPAWVALDLVLVAALLGAGRLRAIRWRRPAALAAAAAVAAALLFGLGWQAAVGPEAPLTPIPSPADLGEGFGDTVSSLREAVGGFDYLEFGLPIPIALAWLLLAAALPAAAVSIARARERAVLLAAIAVAALGPAYLYAAAISHTGFGLQGRTMLPLFIPAVLLAGQVLAERAPARLGGRYEIASAAIIALVALLQVAAWWVNARRFAVGLDGPLLFFLDPDWSPPLGWAPWLALVLAGALLIAAAAWRLASPRLR